MSDDECIHGFDDPAWCGHCRAAADQTARTNRAVHVSPARVGHLDGCTRRDAADRSQWGEATFPGAWRTLLSGTPVTADAGSQPGLVADKACPACVSADKRG